MKGRAAVLAAVRAALDGRKGLAHPGPFQGARPGPGPGEPLHAFTRHFLAAGGEVFLLRTLAEARAWMEDVVAELGPAAVGPGVPPELRPRTATPPPAPEEAGLGVSMARGAVAETGSLLLDARDNRRVQLLPPAHLVWVRAESLHATLADALAREGPDLTSALALHSGPSKSADIGQILVRGVHGPGRVLAAFLLHDRS